MTPKEQLQRAIDLAGNASQLADRIGGKATASHVFNWLNRDKDGVSAQYVIPTCRAVEFRVTPHQLRPDLYPNAGDGMPAKHRKQIAA